MAVLSSEHRRSGIRLAFYKDHSVSFWRKMNVAGGSGVRGVSKHEKTSKKMHFSVGRQVRDDMAIEQC